MAAGSGLFYLFLGKVVSDFAMAVSSILVARLLGAEIFGIAGVALIPAETFALFANIGITAAMTRFSAFYRSQDNNREAMNYVFTGVSTQILIGLLLSAMAFVTATPLAEYVFHSPELSTLFQVASPSVLLNSLSLSCQAAFVGFGKMKLYSATLIIHALLKTSLAPLLAVMGYGALGVVSANIVSVAVSSLLSLALVYAKLTDTSNSTPRSGPSAGRLKNMVSYGLPLFVSGLLGGAANQIYRFLMAVSCSELSIGNYLVATKFSVLIAFFTMPIATVLFPAFSGVDRRTDSESLGTVFRNSVKYTALTALPIVSILAVLSTSLILLLYGEGYSEAPLYLALFALSNAFVGLGGLSIGSLFNGQGMTRSTMLLNVIGLVTGAPLAFYLIPRLQIVGLLATQILAHVPVVIAANVMLKSSFGLALDWDSALKVHVSAIASALIIFAVQDRLLPRVGIYFFAGVALFALLYALLLVVLRGVTRDDLRTLGSLFSQLGPISTIINVVLRFAHRLLDVLQRE